MRTLWDRLVHRLMLIGIPALIVALVCTVGQLSVPVSVKVRQLSLAVIPTATIDTSSTAVGISDSDLYFQSAADVATTLDALKSLGVTQVRLFIPWAAVEAKADVYDWANVDKVVNAAAERGMAVLAAVTSTPKWAGGTALLPNTAPKNTGDYATFMSDLAKRYSASSNGGTSKIQAYEVWNEPNGFQGWSPSPNAANYTALLKAAYTAIKAADSSATVIGGVVGAGLSFGSLTVNPVTFVTQMYANGAQGYFDALSFHPYQYKMLFSAGDTNSNSPLVQLKALRALMDKNGDTSKLIWSTEYGLPTSAVSESTQANFISDFLNAWSSLTGVGPMFIYNTRDREANSSDNEDNFGIFFNNWTPKQAAAVIEAWIAAHGGEVPTDPTTPTTPTDPTTPTTPTTPTNSLQQFFNQVTQAVNDLIKSLADALKAALSGNKATTATVTTLSVAAPAVAARMAVAPEPVSVETTQSAAAQTVTVETVKAPAAVAEVVAEVVAEPESPAPAAVRDSTETVEKAVSAAVPADPVTEPAAEPVAEVVAEPVAEVVADDPVSEPVAEDPAPAAEDVAADEPDTTTESDATAKVSADDAKTAAPAAEAVAAEDTSAPTEKAKATESTKTAKAKREDRGGDAPGWRKAAKKRHAEAGWGKHKPAASKDRGADSSSDD